MQLYLRATRSTAHEVECNNEPTRSEGVRINHVTAPGLALEQSISIISPVGKQEVRVIK